MKAEWGPNLHPKPCIFTFLHTYIYNCHFVASVIEKTSAVVKCCNDDVCWRNWFHVAYSQQTSSSREIAASGWLIRALMLGFVLLFSHSTIPISDFPAKRRFVGAFWNFESINLIAILKSRSDLGDQAFLSRLLGQAKSGKCLALIDLTRSAIVHWGSKGFITIMSDVEADDLYDSEEQTRVRHGSRGCNS